MGWGDSTHRILAVVHARAERELNLGWRSNDVGHYGHITKYGNYWIVDVGGLDRLTPRWWDGNDSCRSPLLHCWNVTPMVAAPCCGQSLRISSMQEFNGACRV